MSVESSRNLLARLRDVENHYARLDPARGAEARLLARFEAQTSSQRKSIGLAWRTLWRPLVIVAACLAVLAISLHDEIPRAQRMPFRSLRPNAPAASTDIPTPLPKPPRKPLPRFHDSIVPAPGPTNELPRNVPPILPHTQDMPSLPEDPIDLSQPRSERMQRIFFSYPSFAAREDQNPISFNMSTPDLYWSGASASKSDNPLRGWNGTSRSSNASNSDEETSEPAKPNASPVCQWPDALKQAADLDCSEKGLMLTELTFLDPCGHGQFRGETHECAETEIEACVTDTLGDGETCQDAGTWKTLAYDICAKAGQQLTDMALDTDGCYGKAKMAKFTCCTPAPPSPPPVCHAHTLNNDGLTCKDLVAVKQEAWDACVADGSHLVDLQVSLGDCPPGQASKILIVCCDG